IGAALTVGLRNAGVLLALLVLPLYVPVLVFGAGVVIYAVDGLATDGVLALLAAMAIAAWTLAPAAVAAGLRISSGN
ncbi:MAG: heme exporter protein CcmB, partial [Alcanivoracaceae bacterium]